MWRMMIGALALFLCAGSLTSNQASAQNAAASPNAQAAETLVREIGAWGQANNARVQALLADIDLISAVRPILVDFAEGRSSQAEARARLLEWRGDLSAAMERARSSFQSAPPPPNVSMLGPQGVALQSVFDSTTANNIEIVNRLDRLGDDVLRMALAALNGEEDVTKVAAEASVRAGIELVEIENVTIRSAIAALPPSHPNASLLRSRMEINNAVVVYMNASRNAGDGTYDLKADARRLAAIASEVRRNAELSRAEASQFMVGFARAEGITETMRSSIQAAFATFGDSAAVVLLIADDLDAMASALSVDTPDFGAADALIDSIVQHSETLVRQDGARAALLANR